MDFCQCSATQCNRSIVINVFFLISCLFINGMQDLGGGNIVMQAKKAFAAGDVVLRIPKRLVISSDMIKSTPQGARVVKLLERKGIEYSEQWNILLLELYILTDRLNSESRFRLFYDMLPTNLAGFPSTWSYEELCELQSGDIMFVVFLSCTCFCKGPY